MPIHTRMAPAAASAILTIACLVAPGAAGAAEPETYGDDFNFLVAHTKVVQLTGENGERVAICPEYQGRVMTSSTSDLTGLSHGWVNRDFIARRARQALQQLRRRRPPVARTRRRPLQPVVRPRATQSLENWLTPPGLNDGAFQITSTDADPYYRLARRIRLQNASRTQFDIEILREIHLQKLHHFGKLFGAEAQIAVTAGRLRMVGFQTINTITNRGAAMTRPKGLLSIWSLGQFPAGARTSIIIPYKDGDDPKLGPIVNSDYFGEIPKERLRVNSQAIWFAGDGKFRSKVGVSQARVKPIAGSIDLENGVLTLVHFTMPSDPTNYGYVNNNWGKQKEPYQGDVFNSYNDGPPAPGKPALGGFYELESLSPAAQLPTGKSITHEQATFHLEGTPAALARVAKAALGVDIKIDDVASDRR